MKRHSHEETKIYFRARRIADEIAANDGSDNFSRLMRENSQAERLVRDLSSPEHARRVHERSAAHDPEADRRSLMWLAAAAPKRRQRALRWSAAAAAILIAGAGLAIMLTRHERAIPLADIAPGTSRAILTLADGTAVPLDGGPERQLTQQHDIAVSISDGVLSYSKGTVAASPLFNTITIPRGAEHRVSLSDGTTVWLNAQSRLRFPVPFTADERRVQLTGEAYFEVTHDAGRPFVVESRGQVLTVLGTRFNVKAYEDENVVASTLVEGSVSVREAGGSARVTLSPGTQALFDNETHALQTRQVDVGEAISWKDGFISIEQNSLEEVLAKLSRWYDVEFKITGGDTRGFTFRGDIPRRQTLLSVVEMLEKASRIKFIPREDYIEVKVK